MRRLVVASLAVAAVTVPVSAQNANCAGQAVATSDACEKATDLWNYLVPQLGTSLVGGSHTLGVGSTLGGLGKFAVALRMNAVMGTLPDVDQMSVSVAGRQSSDVGTSSQVLGLPGVDLAVGVWRGLPLGVTRVGGIDLLGNVTYVPTYDGDGLSITTTGGSTKFGYGARVGLLEQSLVVPGVAVSYQVRDLPTMNFVGEGSNFSFGVNDFSVKTTSWRLSAQKNLMVLQFAAGLGQDTYKSSASISADVTGPPDVNVATDVSQSLTRTVYYGSVGFNLAIVKLVAELGAVTGGSVATYNQFDEPADKSRLFGSLGLRVSF